MEPLRNNPLVNNKWCIPMIQGFVTQFTTLLKDNQPIQYTLITRRSQLRGGTRYNHRGIDEDGNAANFCESEQILQLGSICCSHRQIRGSVPLFWEQKGFQANLKMNGSEEGNSKAFLMHFKQIEQDYSNVMCVNLMSKTKNHELLLTQQFENQIKTSQLDFLRYEFFDFHEACKGFNFENVNILAERLKPITHAFKFFALDNNTNKTLFEQIGAIRTNCLDCLDRTNVFMTKIGACAVEYMMNHMNKDVIKEFGMPILKLIDSSPQESNIHPFMINFRHAWADNGDHISKHYAGTGATTSKATKQGNVGIMGFLDQSLKGIERFYKGNFEDCYKQECLNIITGKSAEFSHFELPTFNNYELQSIYEKQQSEQEQNQCHTDNKQNSIIQQYDQSQFQSKETTHRLVEQSNQYGLDGFIQKKDYVNLNVLTTTWNVKELKFIENNLDEAYFIKFERQIPPDLICITLQNVQNINGQNGNLSDVNNEFWSNVINRCIMQFGQEYKMVSHHHSPKTNIIITTFVLCTLPYQVLHLQTDEIDCQYGVDQIYGAVGVKYQIENLNFGFLSCYLPENISDNELRIQMLNDFMAKIFVYKQNQQWNSHSFKHLDVQFLLGNLNFQIDLSNQIIQEYIQNTQLLKEQQNEIKYQTLIEFLIGFDQFRNYQKLQNFLTDFKEGAIQFQPQIKESKVKIQTQKCDGKYQDLQSFNYSWQLLYLKRMFIFIFNNLNRYDRIFINKTSPKVEFHIQSYSIHEEIIGSYCKPISSSTIFKFPKCESENITQESLKQNGSQKILFDSLTSPKIFDFFKPPNLQYKKQSSSQQNSRNDHQSVENTQNNSAFLDVTMIMNTNDEDQDELHSNERHSFHQNILNESNQFSLNHEQDTYQKQSHCNILNTFKPDYKQQINLNYNNFNLTEKNDNQVSQMDNPLANLVNQFDSKQNNDASSNEYNFKKSQIIDKQNQSQQKLIQQSCIKDELKPSQSKNSQNQENHTVLGRQLRKMSSFDFCVLDDSQHSNDEKQILPIIKEESLHQKSYEQQNQHNQRQLVLIQTNTLGEN